MITIETAGAGGHAAAATTDTGRAALLTIAAADVQRVLETLADGCMREGGAGAARTTDTSRGLGERPERDPDRAPGPDLHEKPSSRRPPPDTPRKKCDRRIRRPAPGPGLHPDLARVPGPGPDTSREDAKAEPAPSLNSGLSDGAELVVFVKKKKAVC